MALITPFFQTIDCGTEEEVNTKDNYNTKYSERRRDKYLHESDERDVIVERKKKYGYTITTTTKKTQKNK